MTRETIAMRFQVHSDEMPHLYAMLVELPNGKLSRRNALLMRLEALLAEASSKANRATVPFVPAIISSRDAHIGSEDETAEGEQNKKCKRKAAARTLRAVTSEKGKGFTKRRAKREAQGLDDQGLAMLWLVGQK